MKARWLFLQTLFMAFFILGQAQSTELPRFKNGEPYSKVRTKMLSAGWKPYHSKDADQCTGDDKRCKGRPEMVSCAGSGMANCKFLWKRNKKTIAICTVEEDAVFDDFCDPR